MAVTEADPFLLRNQSVRGIVVCKSFQRSLLAVYGKYTMCCRRNEAVLDDWALVSPQRDRQRAPTATAACSTSKLHSAVRTEQSVTVLDLEILDPPSLQLADRCLALYGVQYPSEGHIQIGSCELVMMMPRHTGHYECNFDASMRIVTATGGEVIGACIRWMLNRRGPRPCCVKAGPRHSKRPGQQ